MSIGSQNKPYQLPIQTSTANNIAYPIICTSLASYIYVLTDIIPYVLIEREDFHIHDDRDMVI